MNDKDVEHYKQIIEQARSSKRGLCIVKEGIEFSPLIKALIGAYDDRTDRENQTEMEPSK